MGALAYDLAHMLGGVALVLSFVLLYQRRVRTVVHAYAAQAWVVAAAAAWQGWAQDSAALYAVAVITALTRGTTLPLILHRIVRRLELQPTAQAALGVFPSMALGVAAVAVSVLIVLPITVTAGTLTREDFSLALSVLLLGLLVLLTRRTALLQVIGFLSLENGLMMAAVGMTGMPLVAALSLSTLVLDAVLVSVMFVFRLRGRLDELDLAILGRAGQPRS